MRTGDSVGLRYRYFCTKRQLTAVKIQTLRVSLCLQRSILDQSRLGRSRYWESCAESLECLAQCLLIDTGAEKRYFQQVGRMSHLIYRYIIKFVLLVYSSGRSRDPDSA